MKISTLNQPCMLSKPSPMPVMRTKLLMFSILLLTSVLSMGCATPQESPPPPTMTECGTPRPQMCTYIYDPVCGAILTGVQCITTPCPATEYKTFGNACNACADSRTTGYMAGACEAATLPKK